MSPTGSSIELQEVHEQASVLERGESGEMEPDTGVGAERADIDEVAGDTAVTTSSEPQPGVIRRTSTFQGRMANILSKVKASPQYQQQVEDSRKRKEEWAKVVKSVLDGQKKAKHLETEALRLYAICTTTCDMLT